MDLDALRVFVKVAELASFTRAAEQLRTPKSRVSQRLSALEAALGCRLLQRTTRVVRLTADGEQLLPRARRLLADADEVGSMFQGARGLRGLLRLDLPITLAREVILPRLPEFLAAHPQVEVFVSTTDRIVEPTKEGFDCVLRVGELEDSGLTARRLGVLPMMNLASPGYLRRHGTPQGIAELEGHRVVHYASGPSGGTAGFEYRDGDRWSLRPMDCALTVNSVDAYLAGCLAGLGIIQAPRLGKQPALLSGALVELLPSLVARALPVTLLHTHGRSAPRRVRAVMQWLAEVMAPLLER